MGRTETMDTVARFCVASETNDVEGMIATLAPDAELVSPAFAHWVVRGHTDLRVMLDVFFSGLRGLQWRQLVGEGQTRIAIGDARVYGVRIYGTMVIDLDDAGRIQRLRIHARGWLPLTVKMLDVVLKFTRYPSVVGRSLRAHAV